MLKVRRTNRFKKEFTLAEKRGWDMNKIVEIMGLIIAEQPLPERCRPHPLRGGWIGYTECHIENDWLLVYKINSDHTEVLFDRTGPMPICSDIFPRLPVLSVRVCLVFALFPAMLEAWSLNKR